MTEQNNPQPRIFKIGATTIVEDDSLTGKTLDEVKDILKRSYPEVAHATVRERTLDERHAGRRRGWLNPVARVRRRSCSIQA